MKTKEIFRILTLLEVGVTLRELRNKATCVSPHFYATMTYLKARKLVDYSVTEDNRATKRITKVHKYIDDEFKDKLRFIIKEIEK